MEVYQGAQADLYLLHQLIKRQGVDLLIGNTYGKYIARDEDIPFVRFGFPILDRLCLETLFRSPNFGLRNRMARQASANINRCKQTVHKTTYRLPAILINSN